MTAIQAKILTACAVLVALVAGTAALIYTRTVMLPFIFSALIAYMLAPMVHFFEIRLRVKRWLSLSMASTLVFVGLFVLVSLVAGNIKGALRNMQAYQERVELLVDQIFSWTERIGLGNQSDVIADLKHNLTLPYLNIMQSTVGTLGGMFGNITLVVIIVLFILSGAKLGAPKKGIWHDVDHQIRIYLVTKALASLVTGVLTGVILAFIGVDMAFMFGVMACLLNFIPTIGSIVATLLPLPVVLLQFESALPVIAAIALPGLVQFSVGNVVEPKIMGDSLDLHPVTVMLALLFWGLVWGVPGMILATPLVVIAKICLLRLEGGRVFANLLAGELPA